MARRAERDGYDAFISYSHAADGRLAPALQAGLSRFAKPWYKLRALRVFRDDASLSASSELWRSIEQAFSSSHWFVLLASPEAAASDWVGREVAWWLEHRGPDRFLIALTGGELVWDAAGRTVDRARTTALPSAADGKLPSEPRLVDLRWARTVEDVSLANARFRDAVADIASAVMDRPKDELLGEDVRQHQRTRRLVRGTIATLATLLVAAVAAAVVALDQRAAAIAARNRAEERARVALSRQLAAEATSLRASQADLALLLAGAALAVEDTVQARGALLRTLADSKGLGGLLGSGARGAASLAFAPDGSALAVGVPGAVTLWDPSSRRQTQSLTLAGAAALAVAIAPGGRVVAAGTDDGRLVAWALPGGALQIQERLPEAVLALAFDDDGARVAAWDAGDTIAVVPVAGGQVRLLADTPGPAHTMLLAGGALLAGGGQGDLTRRHVVVTAIAKTEHVGLGQPLESAYDARLTRFAGYTLGSRTPYVVDTSTGRDLHDGPLGGGAVSVDALAFSSDGAILAAATARGGIVRWDVASGERFPDELRGHPGTVETIAFSPDGRLIAAAGAGGVSIFDLGHDPLVHSPAVPGAIPRQEVPSVVVGAASVAFSPDGRRVAWPVGATEREVVVWDLEAGREVARFPGDGALGFGADGRELALETLLDQNATIVTLETGARRSEPAAGWKQPQVVAGEPGADPWALASSRGLGASLAFDGTLTLWDTGRGIPLGQLAIPGAFDFSSLAFDREGRQLAVATAGGALSIVDVDVASWLARACTLAGRELTPEEWLRHVGDERPQAPVCDRRS